MFDVFKIFEGLKTKKSGSLLIYQMSLYVNELDLHVTYLQMYKIITIFLF